MLDTHSLNALHSLAECPTLAECLSAAAAAGLRASEQQAIMEAQRHKGAHERSEVSRHGGVQMKQARPFGTQPSGGCVLSAVCRRPCTRTCCLTNHVQEPPCQWLLLTPSHCCHQLRKPRATHKRHTWRCSFYTLLLPARVCLQESWAIQCLWRRPSHCVEQVHTHTTDAISHW